MKKRKISLWLNIVTICLSVCAIAIGVYSIKNANLSIGGSLGFVSHSAKVNIVAHMYGYSTSSSGEIPITEANKTQLTADGGLDIDGETGVINILSTKGSGSESRYFSDASGDLEPIRIVLTITNNSDFEVLMDADVTVPESSKCDFVCDNALQVLYTTNEGTKSKTATLTYILFPKIVDAKYTEIAAPEKVAFLISFSKLNTQISSKGFTFDNATNPTKIYGVPASDGTSDVLVIPSTFTDLPGKTITEIATSDGLPTTAIDTTNFKKLVILDGIKTIKWGSFFKSNTANVGKLEKVALPNTIETLGGNETFSGHSIVSLPIPSSVKNFDSGSPISGTNVRYVKIPSSISTTPTINFYNKLIFAEIEEGVKEIGGHGFYNTLIPSIVIPQGVTHLAGGAFGNCANLTKITLPNSLTNLWDEVFSGSTNLHTIIYKGTMAQWNAIDKAQTSEHEWDRGMNGYTIFCTDGNIVN